MPTLPCEEIPLEREFISWCQGRGITVALALRLVKLWYAREQVAQLISGSVPQPQGPSLPDPGGLE